MDFIFGLPEWVWFIASILFGGIVWGITARKDFKNWYNSIVQPAKPNFWELARANERARVDRKDESGSSEGTIK